ncbi:MAG: hypothetical protein J6Q27_01725, partial [Clostridia bacterium]|nr:hypothetical protein [Clostridia bacterium]
PWSAPSSGRRRLFTLDYLLLYWYNRKKARAILLNFEEIRLFLEGLTDILDDYLIFQQKGGTQI